MKSILGVVGTGLVALSIILTASADNARAGDVSLTHDCINPHGLTSDVDGDEVCGPPKRDRTGGRSSGSQLPVCWSALFLCIR